MASVLAGRLTGDDVRALTLLAASGPPDDKDIALRVLAPLIRQERDRLAPVWPDLHAALHSLVVTSYFRPLGRLAWHLFLAMDSASASAFLLALRLEGRSSDEIAHVVRDLTLCPGPAPVNRLEQIAAMGGAGAALATQELERRGMIANDVLAALARQWRARRDRQSLSRLYDVYVLHLKPGAVDLATVVELLGAPSRDSGLCIWSTDEASPIQLIVEVDARDRIHAWKLK